jgi:methyl-accepting chemotaxis protein
MEKAKKAKVEKIKEKKVREKQPAAKKPAAKQAKEKKVKAKKPAAKKPVMKQPGEKKVKEKSEVVFFRSIQFRMIAAFLVPVLCIIVLGVASYEKASDGIINSYKNSTEQTADMMQQYISLIATSEKDEFKTYLTDSEFTSYFVGLSGTNSDLTTKKSYEDQLRNKLALDTKIKSVFFLADGGNSIYISTASLPAEAYSIYSESGQGALVTANSYDWFVFGQNTEADEGLNIDTSTYSLRLVRKLNDSKAVMMINLDASFIRNAMLSLDPGEDGYVTLVSSDGAEFYADTEAQPENTLVYGTSFYQDAMESESTSGNRIVSIDGRNYLFVYSKLELGDVMVAALIPESVMLQETADIKQLSVILTIIAAIIAMLLGTLISRQMSGTIQYILRQLRKVSKGDLTIHLTSKRKDEFGLLCDGVNDTVAHVKGLIEHVNEVSGQLTAAAAYVSEASGMFLETSQDIQNAVSEIEIGVNRLDSGSEDCMTQMDSLSGKITNVSQNADEIGKLTSTTGDTISNGIESVQGLTASAQSTTEITQNVILAIQELELKSKSISKIVSAINDIAEQTNLLSLNASIEAARAGEAGRGFAVVAEEIRKLSDQCLGSAGQISTIVNEIVEKTQDVVSIAQQAEEVVSTQAGAVEETTASFRQIDQQVESLLAALATISTNVQEMNSSRSETLEAIESISAVSAETAACSSTVYSSAGSQLDAIKDLDQAAQDLRERADKLVDVLGTFSV